MRLIVEIWIQKTKTKFEFEREKEREEYQYRRWWCTWRDKRMTFPIQMNYFYFPFFLLDRFFKFEIKINEWTKPNKEKVAYSFELNFRPKEAKSNEWNWIELKWKWKRERRKEKPRRRKLQQGKRVPFFPAIYIFSFSFSFFFLDGEHWKRSLLYLCCIRIA